MSLNIIKPGILDTIQDTGRFGFQYAGININGAMDLFSSRMANAVLGKDLLSPVLELHFPAAQIQFKKDTIICICGGDFAPMINATPIPHNHAIVVPRNAVLSMKKLVSGARCYLACLPALDVRPWMNSFSTNLKAEAGGWKGRALKKGDLLNSVGSFNFSSLLRGKDFCILPWQSTDIKRQGFFIDYVKGSEWNWLTNEAQDYFKEALFQVSTEADRMGFRLHARPMELKTREQLVSSAVTFGTIQLLPDGHLIVLMADHQTTGGYPRVANVINADLPILAQKRPNDVLQFRLTDLASAEHKFLDQEKYLHYLQDACKFKIENILNASMRS